MEKSIDFFIFCALKAAFLFPVKNFGFMAVWRKNTNVTNKCPKSKQRANKAIIDTFIVENLRKM